MTEVKKENSSPLERKFVRVLGTDRAGLVEFSFAVGEPELCVELILPERAFKEFCEVNKVILLTETTPPKSEDGQEWSWTLRDATQQRFK